MNHFNLSEIVSAIALGAALSAPAFGAAGSAGPAEPPEKAETPSK